MDKRGNEIKAEKILLGVTALFLIFLLALYFHDQAVLRASPVGVETEKTVPWEPAPPPEPVDLNTASAEDLAELPGIGEVLAERIVEYRTAHGPFDTVEDLLEVSGIGETKLAGLEGRVTAGEAP